MQVIPLSSTSRDTFMTFFHTAHSDSFSTRVVSWISGEAHEKESFFGNPQIYLYIEICR